MLFKMTTPIQKIYSVRNFTRLSAFRAKSK